MPLGAMTRFTNLLVAAATTLALVGYSAHAQRSPAFTQEITAVATYDGLRLPAVFTYPPGGAYSGGPAILHLPDGPGTSAVRRADAARFAAEGLAERGFVNLSLEPRYAQSYAFSRFDDAIADVSAAVDMLVARGFTGVVLSGHGLGTLLAARYIVETGDNRVKAVALYSPSHNLAEVWRREVGEDRYWDTVDTASRAVNEGGHGTFVDLGDGLIFTPASFLDWYGPTAKTSLTANLSGIDRPLFLAAGSLDPTVSKGRLEQLEAIAFLAPQVEAKHYAGAGHDFAGARDTLVADTVRWLADIGVAPAVQISTKLVDVTTADGAVLSGVLYAPVDTTRLTNRPAILLAHGWTGDIMRSTSHWLGRSLAQKGYMALAFQTRSSGFRGIVSGKLEDVPADIASWVDFMEKEDHGPLVAAGHSTGSLWFSYYLNQTRDERIKGAVYLAPMRDMPQHARLAMGEDRYARMVLEAQEAVRDGDGGTHLINTPFPQAAYDEDARQPMYLSVPGAGFTYYYADSFLSYWGPVSKAVHKQLVVDIDIPLLALGGSRDPFMQGAYLIDLTEAAGNDASYIFYGGPDGATNSFDGYESRVADDIDAWLDNAF
jgi:alpha-beta hydrolase superfamily lysophospholipase